MAITSPLQALCLFFVYSFLGWGVEVAFHAVSLGKLVNRGFLNGPVCPIYGFGKQPVLAVFGRHGCHHHHRAGGRLGTV